MLRPVAAALLTACALAACRGNPEDRAAKERLFSPGEDVVARAPFDWSHPEAVASLTAEEAATRLGAFDFTGTLGWTVQKGAAAVHVTEHHHVRQAPGGDFEVTSDIDPGTGPGSENGNAVIYSGHMTYARGRYGPWRERPTDRGRDARRFREESFGLLGEVARLCGGALQLRPVGEATVEGRRARRFDIAAGGAVQPQRSAEGAELGKGGPDPDTQRRFAFLDGQVPEKIDGEVFADEESGVPLKVRLRATFRMKGDRDAHTQLELAAQMKQVAAAALSVAPPKGALPDERKTRGVAKALEAAGLKAKRADGGSEEEGDEGE
jgi:hypothetical protein